MEYLMVGERSSFVAEEDGLWIDRKLRPMMAELLPNCAGLAEEWVKTHVLLVPARLPGREARRNG